MQGNLKYDIMKILWFSNVNLTTVCKATGSWLYSMSQALVEYTDVNLVNITQISSVSDIQQIDMNERFTQYLIPCYDLKDGIPKADNIIKIQNIVNKEAPDIVHIWGTESYWGLLTARGYIKGRVLLEMQGIISTCYKAFYANLTPSQIIRCFSIKEFLLPTRSLPFLRYNFFKKWITKENEILQKHKNIAVQSDWVKQYVNLFYRDKNIYHSMISVRKEFLEKKWEKSTVVPNVTLVTITSSTPYKGLIDIIYATSYLKSRFSAIKLYIVGSFHYSLKDIRTSGYERMVIKTIKKLGLKNNIVFCGALNAKEIVDILSISDVFVQSSYIESYSLAVAEAMAFGIPSVVTYAGAIPELGEKDKNLSFYAPGDTYMCASKILNLLSNPPLQQAYSGSSREIALNRNDLKAAVDNQLKIYRRVLNDK